MADKIFRVSSILSSEDGGLTPYVEIWVDGDVIAQMTTEEAFALARMLMEGAVMGTVEKRFVDFVTDEGGMSEDQAKILLVGMRGSFRERAQS